MHAIISTYWLSVLLTDNCMHFLLICMQYMLLQLVIYTAARACTHTTNTTFISAHHLQAHLPCLSWYTSSDITIGSQSSYRCVPGPCIRGGEIVVKFCSCYWQQWPTVKKKKKKKKGYAHRRGLRKGPLIAEARGHLPSKQQDSGG